LGNGEYASDENPSHEVERTNEGVFGVRPSHEPTFQSLPQMPSDVNDDETLNRWEPRVTPEETPTPDVTPVPEVPKTKLERLIYYDTTRPAGNLVLCGVLDQRDPGSEVVEGECPWD